MTVDAPPSLNLRTRPRSSWSLLAYIFVLVGVSGIGALIVLTTGAVEGTEFSPSAFQERSYQFYRIPVVRIQVTPTMRWDVTTGPEKDLRSGRLISTSPANRGRWDLVKYTTGSGEVLQGPAKILTTYLSNARQVGWVEWNRQHTEHAAVLWPAIQEAALAQAYPIIPPLFDLQNEAALLETDAFRQRVHSVLAEGYVQCGGDAERSGDQGRAVNDYRAALRYRPDWPEVQERLRVLGAQ